MQLCRQAAAYLPAPSSLGPSPLCLPREGSKAGAQMNSGKGRRVIHMENEGQVKRSIQCDNICSDRRRDWSRHFTPYIGSVSQGRSCLFVRFKEASKAQVAHFASSCKLEYAHHSTDRIRFPRYVLNNWFIKHVYYLIVELARRVRLRSLML